MDTDPLIEHFRAVPPTPAEQAEAEHIARQVILCCNSTKKAFWVAEILVQVLFQYPDMTDIRSVTFITRRPDSALN